MNALECANQILKKLNDNGFEAYIVGGYVRDTMFGLSSDDIDITTSARVDDLKKLFEVVDNGSKYESVTIIKGEYSFEITTFRRDVSYDDHRHPVVEITNDVYEDIKRRDYTVNAMLMDANGSLIDPYNGLDDLKSGVLKMIGDPYDRYDEDALRILRGVYLISKLNLTPSSDVYAAMCAKSSLLLYVSNGRKRKEISKIIKHNTSNKALKTLHEVGALRYLPSLENGIEYLIKNNIKLRDVFLFYTLCFKLDGNINKSYEFDRIYSKRIENVIKLSSVKLTPLSILDYDYDIINEANKLKKLMGEEYIEDLDMLYDNMAIHSIKEIKVDREFLKGIVSGKRMTDVLNEIADAILRYKVKNNSKDIISYLEAGK